MQKILIKISFFLLFVYLFVNFFRPVTAINEDLGRHLLLGKIIVQTHTVPKTNLLSYTFPNYPFINSHWLSEVIFYQLANIFGMNSLIVLSTILAIITITILILYLSKRYPLYTLLIPGYLSVSMLVERSDVRPELFSFALFSLFLVILFAFRGRYNRWVYLLIPLQLLWINLHIYFASGLLLIALFLVDALRQHGLKATRKLRTLGLVMILSVVITIINPNGLQGAFFPLFVSQNYGFPVLENQSFFYLQSIVQEPSMIYFEISLAVLLLCFIVRASAKSRELREKTAQTSRRASLARSILSIDFLLPLTFAIATFLVYRNLPLFALAMVIPLTRNIAPLVIIANKFLQKYTGEKNAKLLKSYMLLVFSFLLLGQVGRIIWLQPPGFGIIDNGKQTADFFLEKHLQEPNYNNFDIGGYLAYRIYPQKVFIDNRPEAYPKDFAKTAYDSTHDPKIFAKLDKKYNFQTVIFSHWDRTPWKNELLSSLLKNSDYSLIYLDDYATIFVKNDKQFQKITEENFVLPKNLSAEKYVRYIYFFKKVGWKKQEKNAFSELQKVDPSGVTLKRYLSALKEGNNLGL